MTPFVQDADLTIHVGDALEVLRSLPDESVHCCVTSPPYWGLRDYGTGAWDGGDPDCDHSAAKIKTRYDYSLASSPIQDGSRMGTDGGAYKASCPCGATRVDRQLGLEATPDEYVAAMVAVFREVRRVLRRDGTCWLNLGDSYVANAAAGVKPHTKAHPGSGLSGPNTGRDFGLKPKDLVGIPWRVAFALQADGWYLRSDIVWSKPNPMPESVTDRPTKAHEYVFLLSRSPRYFFDAEAVREKYRDGPGLNGGAYSPPGQSPHGNARGPDGRRATAVKGADGSLQHRDGERWPNGGRNVRSVWEIATQPYPQAHFATFPEALPERCILAGTSERGCCPVCGAPWERETEAERLAPASPSGNRELGRWDGGPTGQLGGRRVVRAVGWRPSYGCVANSHTVHPVPCVVLDPFLGSGTTALVARRLGRRCIGIELSPEYARLAADRTRQLSLLAEPA